MQTLLLFLAVLVRVSIVVVAELFAALLVYMYLAVYNRDVFASLIRFSDWVLNASVKPTLSLFPVLEGQAYVTLVGELAPKAMLLLLIGLSVGAAFRILGWLISRMLLTVPADRRV